MPLLKGIYEELYKLNQLNSVKNKSYISNEIGLIDGWNGKEFFNFFHFVISFYEKFFIYNKIGFLLSR